MTEERTWWVLVGGRRRLGLALAGCLAEEHDLVLTSSRPWKDMPCWIKEQEGRTRLRTCCWDAEDPAVVPKMMTDLDLLGAEGIRPAGAVILAGGFPADPLGTWTADGLNRLWNLNVTFPLLAAQALASVLTDGGSLQLVLDAGIHRPWPGRIPYIASKSALASAVVGLARALAPRIRVVGHALGTLLPDASSNPEVLAEQALLKTIGQPEDLVRAVRYARDAAYLTGEILTLDGGTRWR